MTHSCHRFDRSLPSTRTWAGYLALLAALTFTVPLVAAADTMPAASVDQAGQPPASSNARRYRATRAFVVDRQSGQRRMPTDAEVAELVSTLTTLTARPTESAAAVAGTTGSTVGAMVDAGFGGVVLARPNADGTFETRCVFTFEEGADFMGLVAENQ
jgi:hypothetical protein